MSTSVTLFTVMGLKNIGKGTSCARPRLSRFDGRHVNWNLRFEFVDEKKWQRSCAIFEIFVNVAIFRFQQFSVAVRLKRSTSMKKSNMMRVERVEFYKILPEKNSEMLSQSTERCKVCGISKIPRFTKIVEKGPLLRIRRHGSLLFLFQTKQIS